MSSVGFTPAVRTFIVADPHVIAVATVGDLVGAEVGSVGGGVGEPVGAVGAVVGGEGACVG